VGQLDLFSIATPLPAGLVYQPDFISMEEERELLANLQAIAFGEIKMHGVIARRRAAHYGRNYEYQSAAVSPGAPIPDFLLPLRERVGAFAAREPEEFAEVLLTEYPAGAGIGWHRDAPAFDIVVGVSLLAACTMQFRPWPVEKSDGTRRKPLAQILEPRSAYIIRGPSRTAWQHHIPAIKHPRYSITFRTLRNASPLR
jgi:alkylated DNA repair dioxygenase AlkB